MGGMSICKSHEEKDGARIFGEWDEDCDGVPDNGEIYEYSVTLQDYRRYCRKKSVRKQLYDCPGPIGYDYYETDELDECKTRSGELYYHELARDVIRRYNSEQRKNLELKQILKLNAISWYAFMTIEVWDNNYDGDVRRYQLAVVDEKHDRHPTVGWFKDVTSETTNLTSSYTHQTSSVPVRCLADLEFLRGLPSD